MSYLHNQKALAFLRGKLSEKDFAAFLEVTATDEAKPLETLLSDLSLSRFIVRHLEKGGIRTIYDAIIREENYYLNLPRFARRRLEDLKEALAKSGWRLGDIPKASDAA